jgi:cobalt-zinc-cadmium efflux system membrane fusion protein
VALISLVLVACQGGDPAATPPSGEVWLTELQVQRSLKLEIAGMHEVGTIIPCSGKIVFDELRVAHVLSPVTGIVTRILADPGMAIAKGGRLAMIQSPDLGSTSSDLGKARADLTAAKHEFHRKRDLWEYHAVSKADYELARENYKKARAEEERARKKTRLLKRGDVDAVTQAFTLSSPIEGNVITRSATPGLEVQGSFSGGTPVELFTVGDLQVVWMIADVYQVDLARVKVGQRVTVRVVTYANRVFDGVVEWVSDALDDASRTGKVRCSFANPDHELKPEMYVTASIQTGGRLALAVPRSAILRVSDGSIVFVEKRDERRQPLHGPSGQLIFVRTNVIIDEDDQGDYVPVKSGLESGDVIVAGGAIELLGSI